MLLLFASRKTLKIVTLFGAKVSLAVEIIQDRLLPDARRGTAAPGVCGNGISSPSHSWKRVCAYRILDGFTISHHQVTCTYH